MTAPKKRKPPLRLLPGGFGPTAPDPGCRLIAQAVMAGPQDHRVQAANAQHTGRGHGVLSIRVGRLLVYLEDRAALLAWQRAIERAVEVQDAAFGPEMPETKIVQY